MPTVLSTFVLIFSSPLLTAGMPQPETGVSVRHSQAALFDEKPVIGSPAWLQIVEDKLGISDDQGHGPDLGSAEWLAVVDRRLGISGRDNGRGPAAGTAPWYAAVDAELKIGGRTPANQAVVELRSAIPVFVHDGHIALFPRGAQRSGK